ncbi:hypothetical protein BGZ52_007378 [Haplosporangium bisporale]|nr:hypothetical protein BGZ52_007378 [Haplosporangium bisporale]KFH73341.1 hypothetical protein MVEG_00557 [Podila verticillata NRRL 6337]
MLTHQLSNPESTSSSRFVRAVFCHYSDTAYHRSVRTIESEKFLIFGIPFNRWAMFPTASFSVDLFIHGLFSTIPLTDSSGTVLNSVTNKSAPPVHNAAITFYIAVVSALQKWFPDRRGLAAGFAVCGFGAGSIVLAKIPQPLIESIGLPLTFVVLRCCYFVAMFLCAVVFRVPPPGFQVNGMDMYRN